MRPPHLLRLRSSRQGTPNPIASDLPKNDRRGARFSALISIFGEEPNLIVINRIWTACYSGCAPLRASAISGRPGLSARSAILSNLWKYVCAV